ncbi:MAG TPA: hypothetical protein P5528_02320 [Steroidobacteraceae bacterium]|nr:hypothetical protein [Steroidobacteraceae bacterium]HRX88256.1 hypothetical protein [Steroidobacteraceae bacterium]
MLVRKFTGVMGVVAICVLPALASADNDRCTNVRFKFTNNHPTERAITVTGIEYEDLVNNRKVSRRVGRVSCAYGETCLTGATDLRDVEGNNIKNVRFVYKYKERDDDWSDNTRTEPFDLVHKECRADRVYGPGPKGFVIGGAPAP